MFAFSFVSVDIDFNLNVNLSDASLDKAGAAIKRVLVPKTKGASEAIEDVVEKNASATSEEDWKEVLSALSVYMLEETDDYDLNEKVNAIFIDFDEALSDEEKSKFMDPDKFAELLQEFDGDCNFREMHMYDDCTGVSIDLHDTTVKNALIMAYSLDDYFQRCGIENHIKKVDMDYYG